MAFTRNFVLWFFAAVCTNTVTSFTNSNVFDQELYESLLDEEQCERQLTFLSNNQLGLQFLDASAKLPSGILTGHLNDLGDYYQCLSIDQLIDDMDIKGKYCTVTVPLEQNPIPEWPELPEWPDWNITLPNITLPNVTLPNVTLPWMVSERYLRTVEMYSRVQMWSRMMSGDAPEVRYAGESVHAERIFPMATLIQAGMTLAVCVPRVCTARQAIEFLQRYTALDVEFNEYYCRLPGDKPYVAADYVAMVFFAIIGVLTVTSTSYDLYYTYMQKIGKSKANPLYRCFSVYTNTRRFLSFNTIPGALECIDGIRAISMIWIVVGHTHSLTLLGYVHNLADIVTWIQSFSSVWVNSAPIVVDTFFLLSGILCVYTVVGKITRTRFVRTLHLFYLNRLLRMFPLLAVMVLLQCSFIHRLTDGPAWINVANATDHCRKWWWSALLHVQNYVNPLQVCLVHTWYLSVDTQLYMICPVILFFMFGTKRFAWITLTGSILLTLVSASLYSYFYNFSAALANFQRIAQFNEYVQLYYMNTLTRATPFFIGMAYGYLLHLWRGKKLRIPKMQVMLLWTISLLTMVFCILSMYPVMQPDHTAQNLDNFLNAYMRSLWALALGWLIFACVHGYGGPINWFLSLSMWKLLARMSYAMYMAHVPIIMLANGSWVKTHYFAPGETIYRFASDLMLTFVAAFVLCVTIDAPFSTLQKLLMGKGKKPREPKVAPQPANNIAANDDKITKTKL